MQTITVEKKKVQEIYARATEEGRVQLAKLFRQIDLNPLHEITSFEDICRLSGEDPENYMIKIADQTETRNRRPDMSSFESAIKDATEKSYITLKRARECAFRKLVLITEVLNKISPVSTTERFIPYFTKDSNDNFIYQGVKRNKATPIQWPYLPDYLDFCTPGLAEFAGTTFLSIYIDWLS